MATSTMKEFFRLMCDVNRFTDGQVEVYLDDDENNTITENETEEETDDNPLTFYLVVTPNGGYYEGGRIKFKVVLDDYPIGPPNVTCCNVIYHPNIDLTEEDSHGSVCVNLLGSDWTPEVGLDGCVMAILFLFYNPQLDDALSPVFSGSDECDDLELFAENVKISMCGGEVDGYTFDNIMTNECDGEKENGENKQDEVKCKSSSVSTENVSSTPEEDVDTNNGTIDKEVDNEAEKQNEEKLGECENGEELNKTDFLQQMKDQANCAADSDDVTNPVDVENTSNIMQNSNGSSNTTYIENARDRTSHDHQNDPLLPHDALGNNIADSCGTSNENGASSFMHRKTDSVLQEQGVETDHAKIGHRQTIVKYIKSKMNVFSGFFKLINQCKGIIQRR